MISNKVKSIEKYFMVILSAGIILLSLVGCKANEEIKTRSKPNIVYILADDLGYGDLGCYGQTKIKTPELDKMANEGILFTDHYAGSTVCAPSRCALMTGLHTGHARVRGNYENGPHGFGSGLELREEDVTVAELLQQSGYRTGLFGKWGLGVKNTSGEPNKKGWDKFYGFLNQGHAHFFYPEYLWDDTTQVILEGNLDGNQNQYSHDLITEEALKFIKENKDTSFFLNLTYTIPHAELIVPENSLKEYKGTFPETPYVNNGDGGIGGYCSQENPKATFAAMVTRMDGDVGRLFDLLKELKIDKNTIVMFSSDNGPHKEGGAEPDFFNSNGNLRGYKRDLYEGGIRVPMIARWPEKIKAGSKTNHISAFWDVLPTLCEIGGAEYSNVDGVSFLPALMGEKQEGAKYLYWEFHEAENMVQAIRMGKWKAVRHSPDAELELYNLNDDLSEEKNIATDNPDVVNEITKLFVEARTEHELWGN